MTTQHTPGPWRHASLSQVTAPSLGIVASVRFNELTDAQVIANARLIAAAPELLEFLQKILSAPGTIDGDKAVYLEQARYVIAKATGGAA